MKLCALKAVLLYMTMFHMMTLANEVNFVKEETEYLEDAMKNEAITITEEEKRFLADTFPGDIGAESGRYTSKQIETLEQFRYLKKHLKDKYPSYSFEIVRCTRKSLLGPPYNVFYFRTSENKETEWTAHVYTNEEDHSFSMKDDFYQALIANEYEAALLQLFSENVPECYEVETKMLFVLGEEYGEGVSAESVIDGTKPVSNLTDVWIDGSASEAQVLVEKMETIIREKEVFGDYHIFITDGTSKDNDITMTYHILQPKKQQEE